MIEALDEHRDDLEALARSDLSCSWIAEILLEATDTESRKAIDVKESAADDGTNRYPSVPASAAQCRTGECSETETMSPKPSCDGCDGYVIRDTRQIFSDYDDTLNGCIECAGNGADRGGRR